VANNINNPLFHVPHVAWVGRATVQTARRYLLGIAIGKRSKTGSRTEIVFGRSHVDDLLKIFDLPATPAVHSSVIDPSESHRDVDGTHATSGRQRRGRNDTIRELPAIAVIHARFNIIGLKHALKSGEAERRRACI
jgi:hypothetical protein